MQADMHIGDDFRPYLLCTAGQCTLQTPWQVSVQCSQYEAVTQSWCWRPTVQQTTVTGSATETWQSLAPGAETKVGCVVECQRTSVSADMFLPQSVSVNGVPCPVSRE